VYTLPVIKGSN